MITVDTENRTTLEAAEKWGAHQLGILQEECAELISACSRLLRGRTDTEPVAEEIADVIVCMQSVIPLLDIEQKVRTHRHNKIERLKRRMKDD